MWTSPILPTLTTTYLVVDHVHPSGFLVFRKNEQLLVKRSSCG